MRRSGNSKLVQVIIIVALIAIAAAIGPERLGQTLRIPFDRIQQGIENGAAGKKPPLFGNPNDVGTSGAPRTSGAPATTGAAPAPKRAAKPAKPAPRRKAAAR